MADWFDDQIVDDGNHPYETSTLRQYLMDAITPDQAARNITKIVERDSKHPNDIYQLAGLLCSALTELPKHNRSRIISLLHAIERLPTFRVASSANPQQKSMEIARKEIPAFEIVWSDLSRMPESRSVYLDKTPEDQADTRAYMLDYATIEVELVNEGIFSLWYACDTVSRALESDQYIWEFELPLVYEWMAGAGRQLYDYLDERQTEMMEKTKNAMETTSTVYPRPAVPPKEETMSKEDRWALWKRRLSDISELKDLDNGLRDTAKRTVEKMNSVRSGV